MHKTLTSLLVLTLCGGLAFAAEPAREQRTDLSAEDLARVLRVTAPTTDFTKPENFEAMQGGGGTVTKLVNRDIFSFSLANLSFEQESDFKLGNAFFTKVWVSSPSSTDGSDGLGPLFNSRACQNCHLKDGRGHPPLSEGANSESMFLRLSVPARTGPDIQSLAAQSASVVGEPTYGTQLQDFAVPGLRPEGRMVVEYADLPVSLADGTVVTLRAPSYSVADLGYGPMAADVMLSPRMASPMIGLGLVEDVPVEDILSHADADDADGDGISGRPNWVIDPGTGAVGLGRFGWKAGQPTIEAQSASAFAGDIGIATPLLNLPAGDCTQAQTACLDAPDGVQARLGDSEAPDPILPLVTFYSQNVAVPQRRNVDHASVLHGKQAFYAAGCSGCHTPKFVTSRQAALDAHKFQLIWPYSDFLLHDMGEGLADHRPEGEASGTEWRTPPLWGIGLTETVSGHSFFLHDGRARSLAEAILWHGGEAQAARDRFAAMSETDRDDLIIFLGVSMIRWLPLMFALLALPAAAQPAVERRAAERDALPAVLSPTIREVVQDAVDDVIRPGFADFHGRADNLADALAALCAGPSEASLAAARDAFGDAALAHARIEHYRFGPLTADNRAERLLFFPDLRGIGQRQIQAVFATEDETATDPATLREKSVALQGLTALEYVLYATGADDLAGSGADFRCRYGAAIARVIDTIAGELDTAWQAEDGIANHLIFPGPDNVDFRTETELLEGLAGVVAHGIEAIRDERLVPMLGGPELERPAPKLALYWRSGLTMPAVGSGFAGLGALVAGSHMAERTPAESRWIGPTTDYQFGKVVHAAAAIAEPVTEAVKDAAALARLKSLLIATDTLRTLAAQGLPQALGLGIGFSALDKDTQ